MMEATITKTSASDQNRLISYQDTIGEELFILQEGLADYEPSFSAWIGSGWKEVSCAGNNEQLTTTTSLAGYLRMKAFRNRCMELALPMLRRYYSADEITYMTGIS